MKLDEYEERVKLQKMKDWLRANPKSNDGSDKYPDQCCIMLQPNRNNPDPELEIGTGFWYYFYEGEFCEGTHYPEGFGASSGGTSIDGRTWSECVRERYSEGDGEELTAEQLEDFCKYVDEVQTACGIETFERADKIQNLL